MGVFCLVTAPHLSISQKALETLPEDGNLMTKHAEEHNVFSDVVRSAHHVTKHNMPIHNILSTVSQKALETFPEDGNVMTKHAEATIHN